MPFGKYKGMRLRLLPDDYLSWMTGSAILADARWAWLKESLIAELRFRGFRYNLASTLDPPEIQMPDGDLPLGGRRIAIG